MSTSANRSGADEFQRTIGALFCIFWLMRQHLDGRECFCFGLDRDWKNAKEFLRIDGGLKIDRKGSIPTFLAKTTKGLHHHWRSRFFFFLSLLYEKTRKKASNKFDGCHRGRCSGWPFFFGCQQNSRREKRGPGKHRGEKQNIIDG